MYLISTHKITQINGIIQCLQPTPSKKLPIHTVLLEEIQLSQTFRNVYMVLLYKQKAAQPASPHTAYGRLPVPVL